MGRPARVTKQIHGWVRAHPHFSPTACSSCLKVKALLAQSCLTLCNPMNRSLPGSSVHGILQARILEWVFPSLGHLLDPGIEPGSPALQTDSLPSEPPGKPNPFLICSQPLESFSPNWLSPSILQHPGTNCKVLVYKDSSSDGQTLWFLASRLNCTHRKCLWEPGWRRLQTLFPVPSLSTPAINSKNDPAPDPMMSRFCACLWSSGLRDQS